jgi:hypothetical protein
MLDAAGSLLESHCASLLLSLASQCALSTQTDVTGQTTKAHTSTSLRPQAVLIARAADENENAICRRVNSFAALQRTRDGR